MGAAPLRPTWCLRSTLSTLQAWKKVQSFCEPDNCLFVCCCLGHVQATPGSPVVQSQALQLSMCTTGLCVAPRTHVTGGRLENPPFYLQSTPKETAVSRHTTCSPPDWGLGPYNWALSWGRQSLHMLHIYRWSNFPKVQLTSHHGRTLNWVNRTSH